MPQTTRKAAQAAFVFLYTLLFCLSIQPAQAIQNLDARRVALFSEGDFRGAGVTYELAADEPFLLVAELEPAVVGQIRSLTFGEDIGLLLFQQPYFATQDDRCAPKMGEQSAPNEWWSGMTAHQFGAAPDAVRRLSETKSGNYASLIVYDRQFGPPPAVLLMKRRSYYNLNCLDSLNSSYYNRLVLPLSSLASQGACQAFGRAQKSSLTNATLPDFHNVDELFYLAPSRMKGSLHNPSQHRILIELFNKENCTGHQIAFKSDELKNAQLRLKGYRSAEGFRSARLSYLSGPYLAAFTKKPEPSLAAAKREIGIPKNTTPLPAKHTQSVPITFRTTSEPALKNDTDNSTTTAFGLAGSSLSSATLAQAAPTASTDKQESFRFPAYDGYRLNFCFNDDRRSCGKRAANAYCRAEGFLKAVDWKKESNVGGLFPTILIGSDAICDRFLCDGFEEITCLK